MDSNGFGTDMSGGGRSGDKGRGKNPGVIGSEVAHVKAMRAQAAQQGYVDESPGGYVDPFLFPSSKLTVRRVSLNGYHHDMTQSGGIFQPKTVTSNDIGTVTIEDLRDSPLTAVVSPTSTVLGSEAMMMQRNNTTNIWAPLRNEQDVDGRHARVRTIAHTRNFSRDTVDTMSEHVGFYPRDIVSPRQAIAAKQTAAPSHAASGTSGTSHTTAYPAAAPSSQNITSPAGLLTPEHEVKESRELQEMMLETQRSQLRHGEMLTNLHSITKTHDNRLNTVEGSLVSLWEYVQRVQITQQTQQMQAQQMQLQINNTPVMAQHPQFAQGHFTFPGAFQPPQHAVQGGSMPHPVQRTNGGMSLTTPDPDDDVFGPTSSGRAAAARFDQKDYPELIHSVTVKIEAVARAYCLAGISTKSRDAKVQHLVHTAAIHLDHRGMAIAQLESMSMRTNLIVGLINRWVVEQVYNHPLISHHQNKQLVVQFMSAWNDEVRAQSSPMTANNYPRREALAANRSRIARLMAQLPGFWKWQQELSNFITEDLIAHIIPLIRPDMLAQARNDLYKAVNEAVKIVVRMRQDNKVFETAFYRYGARWDHKGMVQRNDELQGLACDEDPPVWVLRVTMAPWIGEKSFTGGKFSIRTLQKGEVTLCDRKTHLR
ncbi:hypothetical protein LTR36_000021 [Oleoguttula mirabilis]|uniref:Uncharacterized protein n=1 Tax=Oleoguttula mirabilis TaxID=1507867 RepID=A0AAV9JXE6_9PEZI|nr:hypothetical protein LTR36_000021 [Oleoguttula mirabilis]